MSVWSQFIEAMKKGEIRLKSHTFNNYRRYETGSSNKPRRLACHRIHLVETGSIIREINGERFEQTPGRMVWQFPHALSRFEFPGACGFYGLHFDMDISPDPSGIMNTLSGGFISIDEASRFSGDIQEICSLYNQKRPLNDVRCGLRLSDLLCRIVQDHQFPHSKSPLNDIQKALILEYVHEHGVREIHSREVARRLDYSPDYFSRLFKESYGISFRRYQMEERIRMAGLELMSGDGGISDIASRYGYHDIALFSRQFKAVMGLSPRKYRGSVL